MIGGVQKGHIILSNLKQKFLGESSLSTRLLNDLPPEIELSDYQQAPSPGSESPSGLLNGESLKAEPIADLDIFFERVYSYYCGKGLRCIIIKWIFEFLTLAFIIFFSGFFLLFFNWHGIRNVKYGMDAVESGKKPCDLAKEVLHQHHLTPLTVVKAVILGYLGITSSYLIFCFLRFFAQLKDTLEIRLDVKDNEIQTMPWSSILEKVVQVQHSRQLCVVKDLSAHDIVMRMTRKEDYLIGMLNKGVFAFPVSQWVPCPKEVQMRADDILQFVADFTVNVEGVGHVCSFSLFDFKNHGNSKYASPHNSSRIYRSSQGKMEKSFLSFQCSYPLWEPNVDGKKFISTLKQFREQISLNQMQEWTPNIQVQGKQNNYLSSDRNENVSKSFYQLDCRWLVNLDHKDYPYIIDWYYTSHHHQQHGPREIEAGLIEVEDETISNMWVWPDLGSNRDPFDENLRTFLENQMGSNLKDSTSRTILKHHDLWN